MSCDSIQSNVQFENVHPHAIALGLVFGETQARADCARKSSGNKAVYTELLGKYKEKGIVGTSPAVNSLLKTHSRFCAGKKMIHNGNFFGEAISLAPLSDNPDYSEKLKNRMSIGHDLTPEEMEGADEFICALTSLHESPDVQAKVEETITYKRSIERLWNKYERTIMDHIRDIVGDEALESTGKVSVFIMYPNIDMQRNCQLSSNRAFLFLGKTGEELEAKTLASIADGAVRPMIPIKSSMTEADRKKHDAFIRFLSDKEIYTAISGKSGLQMVTPKENHKLMGQMYPYWLGYKHRNDHKLGLDPAVEISKEIQRDITYFDSLHENCERKRSFGNYNLKLLDSKKIAEFFRYKRAITPYEFLNIDFEDRAFVLDSSNEKGKKRQTIIREEI